MAMTWIDGLVRADADAAIERIGKILDTPRTLSVVEWQEIMVLGCSLNNLWPQQLQAVLGGWIDALIPVENEEAGAAFVRRLTRALFWSLYKRKNEVSQVDWIEAEFWSCPTSGDPMAGAHSHAALVVASRDEKRRLNALLDVSHAYYVLHDSAEYRSLMMELLDWTAHNPGPPDRTTISVILAVHTEFEEISAELVETLTVAHHLGPFLPFWALFQASDAVLRTLRDGGGICSNAAPLTKEVFNALCAIRLDLA